MRSSPLAKDAYIFAGEINALRSDARGSTTLLAHQTLGKLALPTNPSDGNTATFDINGTNVVVRFKNTLAAANDVKIGADAAATMINLWNFLTNPQITNSNQIAAASGDQVLLGYLTYNIITTTLYLHTTNKTVNPIVTSFTCSTNVSSGVYTANTMALFVHGGTVYVNGTQVKFAGGLTPTVTAPSSHPRIDVLTIDNSGTLAWTTGSENASPVVPTYPDNKIPIIELYNVVGETLLLDNENQTSGQGYIQYDVRGITNLPFIPSALPYGLIPKADATYDLGSSGDRFKDVYAQTYHGDGSLLSGINSSILTTPLVAAEAISAGQPVTAFLTPVSNIGFDTQTVFATSATSTTTSFTVANNSNRLLVVLYMSQNSGVDISAATYNGVSMTKSVTDTSSGSRKTGIFTLVAPATGANNLVVTAGSSGAVSVWVFSYYNVSQSGAVGATAHIGDSNASFSLTANNALSVLVGVKYSTSAFSGSGFAVHGLTDGIATARAGDSGVLGPTPGSATWTGTGSFSGCAIEICVDMTSATYQAWLAGSNNGATFAGTFVGFAFNSPSAGQSCTIITAGLVSGLTSLSPGAGYYLADTRGTISSSAGTTTKKVGIAITPTQLIVTNIW